LSFIVFNCLASGFQKNFNGRVKQVPHRRFAAVRNDIESG
jgi:hypothetical protein